MTLRTVTTPIQLADFLPADAVFADAITDQASVVWVRNGTGMIGWGHATVFASSGVDRIQQIRNWWSQITEHGSGVRAFSSISFDDRSQLASTTIVPELLLIHDGTSTVLQAQYDDAETTAPDAGALLGLLRDAMGETTPGKPAQISRGQCHMTPDYYEHTVQQALDRLGQDGLSKVVVARDDLLETTEEINISATLRELARTYRHAWTYRVASTIGSTPELLIASSPEGIHARVLAGTVDRDQLPDGVTEEAYVSETLIDSPKQIFEHRSAVDSLLDRLNPKVHGVQADAEPFVLQLPNVWHLATDVQAPAQDISVLDLAVLAHPTAAVGGSPRSVALDAIYELEFMTFALDRGHYAGPVGWFDADHHGEFGIALRGGVMETPTSIRLYAGCGIVEGSVPAEELAETYAKMRPMREALRVF